MTSNCRHRPAQLGSAPIAAPASSATGRKDHQRDTLRPMRMQALEDRQDGEQDLMQGRAATG